MLIPFIAGLYWRCPRCGKLACYSEKENLYKEEYKDNVNFYRNISGKYPKVRSFIDKKEYYRIDKKCTKCDYDDFEIDIRSKPLMHCPKCGKPLTNNMSEENLSYGKIIYNETSKSISGGVYTITYECTYSVECSCGWSYRSDIIRMSHECKKSLLGQSALDRSETPSNTGGRVHSNGAHSQQNSAGSSAYEKDRLMREANEAYSNYEYYKDKAESAKRQMETYLSEAKYCFSKAQDDESYNSTARDYMSKAEIYENSYREFISKSEDCYRKYRSAKDEYDRM